VRELKQKFASTQTAKEDGLNVSSGASNSGLSVGLLSITNPIWLARRAKRRLGVKISAGAGDKFRERIDRSGDHLAPVIDRAGDLHLRLR
jgi:hypothetical protein